jgi:cobalt-zinc-cadmium efflux system outer membrane protein
MIRRHWPTASAGVTWLGAMPLRAAMALQSADVSRQPTRVGCSTEVEPIGDAGIKLSAPPGRARSEPPEAHLKLAGRWPGLLPTLLHGLLPLLLLVLWTSRPAQAQGAAADAGVTWTQAVDAAWRRSAQSAEAAGLLRRAQAERTAASSLWAAPPAMEVGQIRDRQQAGRTTRETEVGVSVPLWLPGQRPARLDAADAEGSAATAAASARRLRVAGIVREAGWEVTVQRGELAAAELHHRELDALAKDVERRVAAGDLARADALAANAERLSGVSATAQARQRLQAAQAQWTALTGLASVPDAPYGPTASSVPTGSHPLLREAAVRVELAQKRLEVVKASRRDAPELLIRGRQETTSGEPNVNGFGLALRLPFGTADRNEPLMASALSELEVAQAEEQELRTRIEADVAGASSAEAAARQQVADEAARARLLRERAKLIEASYKAGETALPEMLRALTAAAQAEASAMHQQAVAGRAAARLEQALGVTP